MKFLASALLALVFVPVESAVGQESTPDRRALESTSSGLEKNAATQNSDAQEILGGFKSYYIKSDSVYLHRDTLLKELQKRGEFSAWELTATEGAKSADVVITVTLPFLTWEWNYRMVHQPTGRELGSGKVSAAVERTAVPQLAAMIVKRIRDVRPLPVSFQEAQSASQAPANSSAGNEKSWRVSYSGPESILRKHTPVTLTVSREWITVRDTKTFSLSIPVANVRTADSRTEVRKATKGWEDFWDRNCCGDNDAGAVLLIAPIFLAGYGILAPIKTTDHFVSMYWTENGSMRGLEFRVSAGDIKSLLAELKKATGRNAEDLQEVPTRRQKLVAEQYEASPIVELKSPVTLGWNTLWPGRYHLVFIPRSAPAETGLAEVYFYVANKPTPDFLGGDCVAELERRETPLEDKASPSVSYREQNGIATFSQIETDQFILRFTPVPLGFAK
jgi:hypothetical protein